MRKSILSLVLLFVTLTCAAQFQKASFMVNGKTLPYQVSFPDGYDKSKQYPLLIFLHGAGERGYDNELQLTHGKDFLLEASAKYNTIVIAPQCPPNMYWCNVKSQSLPNERIFDFTYSDKMTNAMEVLTDLISDWIGSGKIDTSKVVVGGLSMGGMGTFELLWRMPNTFSSAFICCGGGNTNKVNMFAKKTKIWIFHGTEDNVVPVSFSSQMNETLQKQDCNVKFTLYPKVNHNSWENMFKEKDLLPWLMR